MAFADITSRQAVLQAIAEYDTLGRRPFLKKYGFGEARKYFVLEAGKRYDSKAIVGAAHGFQFPTVGPLKPSEFAGGDATVKQKLEGLGFTIAKTPGRNEQEPGRGVG